MSNVFSHHLHAHRQQDDTEELAREHHASLAKQFLNLAGALDDKEHPNHVDGKADEDVHVIVHRLERDERC